MKLTEQRRAAEHDMERGLSFADGILGMPLGEQFPEEILWLLDRVRQQKCRSVLEIGSRKGNTLRMLAYACGPGARVRAIDIADGGFAATAHELHQIGFDADYIIIDSHNRAARDWAQSYSPYDLVFIDGDHEEGVADDWIDYGRMATKMVAFHDIYHPAHKVRGLWQLLKGGKTEEINAPQAGHNPRGIGIVYK